jgi:predicted metalloprotease
MGLGGLLLLLLLAWLMGADPLALLAGRDLGGGSLQVPSGAPNPFDVAARQPGAAPQSDPEEEKLVEFVSFVLDDAQAVWAGLLSDYQDARLVLFRDAIDSACGFAQAAMGPFYCPRDHKVYIDLGFYEELRRRFAAPGDFAQAYVLAHEIGHHVQTLLGIESEIRMLQRARPHEAKALSVRMELQADCLAGVWAHSTVQRDLLERGDLEEGLAAASAVGDDRIQRMSGSRIQPEAFTHGSSRQRVAWFRRGFDAGDPKTCDTFSGAEP